MAKLLTLPQKFRDTVHAYTNETAIIDGENRISFSEIDKKSDQIAAGLKERGIVAGDRIALYCINSVEFAACYLGIVKSGAIVVPINLLLNPKEVLWILNDAGARALLFHPNLQTSVDSICSADTSLEFTVRISGQNEGLALGWADFLSDASVMDSDAEQDDLVSILYTSGTTGKPKGAMLTHRNLVSNTTSAMQAIQIKPGEDVLLTVLPMFHAFAATVGMLIPLLHGATFIPVPRFEPELVAQAIENGGATILLGVPSMYNVLLNMPEKHLARFGSLKYCVSGGAAMPEALMKKFEQRFGIPIYEGDGPTECSPVTCINPIDGLKKHASVGLPIPGVEMSIRDSEGKEVHDQEIGEICVKGPNVMKGYWNRPDATAEVFFDDRLRTGDLGYRDEDGYFYIVDRIKDMIIVNGMNVYPRVIEEVLYSHPEVLEVAVVGEPDERHGEIIVAYVVAQPGCSLDRSKIRSFCQDHLGRYQIPKKVIVKQALPKNAAGKILKRELRKQGELERGIDARSSA